MAETTGWQDTVMMDRRSPLGDGAVYAVIVACLIENPVLAVVNNFLFTLNAAVVAGVQLIITLAALVLVAVRRPHIPRMFLIAGCLFLGCALIKFIVTGSFNPRFLYDAAVLPLFLLLGSSARRFSPHFLTIVLIVLLVTAIVELVFPDVYAGFFNPRKYFYFTRDWVAAVTTPDADITTGSDIYLGSNRYTGSFFGVAHRAGSLFLEPLSVGYFGIVAAILFLIERRLVVRDKAVLIVMCLLLALLSDTRIAVFVILAAVAMRNLAGRAQLRWLALVPFAALMSVVSLYFVFHALPGDLGLRLGVTTLPLADADPLRILFGGVDDTKVADSGYIYLIANAGLVGFCLYPLMASGLLMGHDRPPRVAVLMLFYLMVALAFGYAPMSIKTASILGYGVATLSRVRQEEPSRGEGFLAYFGRAGRVL